MEVPEELDEYVNDYKIKVFSIAYLPKEKVEQFTSDFRIVADYFVQQRLTNEYVPNPQTINHVKETLDLLSVMGDDHRFIDAYNESIDKSPEGGIHTMSDAINTITEKVRDKTEFETTVKYVRRGNVSIEDAARDLKMSVEEFMEKMKQVPPTAV